MFDNFIKDLSSPGKKGVQLPSLDIDEKKINELLPENLIDMDKPNLPEVSEPEVIRHFVSLSTKNYHIDKNLYPLGSCTMKYNPKINEFLSLNFKDFHPMQPAESVQGPLKLMYELEKYLGEIAGMDSVSLQPAAGAHGEFSSLLVARAYFEDKGIRKTNVIVPDSAHGTNPASIKMAGFNVIEIKSNSGGLVDIEALRSRINDETAVFMITNPNTLGLFEKNIKQIADIVHSHNALLYMDGANLNALLGIARPGDMGFDIMHYNLHKTFSTPHGGGGPGSGPIGVKEFLKDYLPVPRIINDNGFYKFDFNFPKSIGRVLNFWGNFSVIVRAYVYIKMMGFDGLKNVSKAAIINANYLLRKLEKYFYVPYPSNCMHEFVISGKNLKDKGLKTLQIAKRLLDYGFHAPTIYFPLIVSEALMIEPTESESKETLDTFVDVLKRILEEEPDIIRNAPYNTPVKKLDEVLATKELKIHW